MIRFSVVLALLLMANTAYGANLVELQQMALKNREVIDRFKANLKVSEKDEIIARSNYYPSFDVSYAMNALDERTLFEERENSAVVGALTWNLFAGFGDKYNIKSARLLSQAEAYRLKGIEQDIKLLVALRYLSIRTFKANLQVAEDSYNTLLKIYKDSQSRYDVGLIRKNDLLQFKVDLDDAEITRKKAQADLKKSVQLLQREIDAVVEIDQLAFTEFDQLPILADYTEYEEEMFENRSEIKVLEETEQAIHAQVKTERARYFPRVDLTSSYSKFNEDLVIGRGLDSDEEIRTQLVVSMNLFDGFDKKSRVHRTQLQAQTIGHDLEELKQDLTTQLKNLFFDYEVSFENVDVAESSITQAEENLRITQLSYKEGLDTESDLLDAIANLSRAKGNLIAAKSEVFANYYNITRAVEGF